jgi:hypothetical protein
MLDAVLKSMTTAAKHSRWAKDRARRMTTKPSKNRNAGPLARMISHLDDWQSGYLRLFSPEFVTDYGFRGAEHQSRVFMLVLKKFDSIEAVANRLLKHETRVAVSYKNKLGEHRGIPESKMREAMMYVFRFPDCRMPPLGGFKTRPETKVHAHDHFGHSTVSYVTDKRRDDTGGISVADLLEPTGRISVADLIEPVMATATVQIPKAVDLLKSVPTTAKATTTKATTTKATTTKDPDLHKAVTTKTTNPSMVVTKKQRTDAFLNPTAVSDPVPTAPVDAPRLTTKYVMILVLPKGIPVSSKEFFNAVSDITPLGCVMASHYPILVTKTCWRSLQVTPVDNWGKWKHVGMGKDPLKDPHMMRINVAQASTIGE